MSLKAVGLTRLLDSDALSVGVGGLILSADVNVHVWPQNKHDDCWPVRTDMFGHSVLVLLVSDYDISGSYLIRLPQPLGLYSKDRYS